MTMVKRKAKMSPRPYDEYRDSITPPSPRKKARAPRVHLTHFEIRRGASLRLRLAIADDAIAEVGDELGALIKKIAPNTQRTVVPSSPPPGAEEFVVTPLHADDDGVYHAGVRERLAELFNSLCDASLADALDIAREERARRAEGGN